MEEFSKIMANSLSPNISTRGQAEQQMNSIVLDTFNLDLLFKYISDQSVNTSLKQAAAVFMMRYVKDYWYDDCQKAIENPEKVIRNETKDYFENSILNMMLSVEPKLIPTIKETIVYICKEANGYDNCWPELMTILAKILKNKNPQISVDTYDLINKITKRYRSEFKSNALFKEIINTLNEIANVMTEDGILCINIIFSDQKNNRDISILYLTMLKYILNIFINLNAQDFPEFFEDNLGTWINILKGSLDFSLNVNSSDHMLNTLFIKVKKTALKSLNLYCHSYYEDIIDYHNDFYPSVWNLVNSIKHEQKYEKLIKELLDYYKNIFQYKRPSGFDSVTIQHLINNLIIPEMRLTAKELDDFEENPINYLKVELEEIDMDSNKYHAINLLKSLINIYNNMTNEFIKPLIMDFLNNYYLNPQKSWMDKISAINLIFATMIKTFAQRIGATEVNASPDEIRGLIESIFLKEFNEVATPVYIAKIYSLKFLSTLRLQIPQEWLNSIINMLVNILKQSDNVIQTAALLTLEKILFMKDTHSNVSLVRDAVNNQETFVELIGTLVKVASTSINFFAMRCLFRTVFLTSEGYYKPIIESLSTSFNEILKNVIASPSEDQFNYFLFETIAMIMKKLNSVDIELYNIFVTYINVNLVYILEKFVTDLIGYTFQIFALMLSMTKDNEALNDTFHKSLINSILFEESNWNFANKYLFIPLTLYLKVSFVKCRFFYESNKMNLDQLFKIVNKLLELKSYSLTFDILDHIINSFDFGLIFENLKALFYNFLIIYNNLKTNNKKAYIEYSKILVVFLSKILIKTNSKVLVDILETIQQGLTVALLTELAEYMIDLEHREKKLVFYSYCTIIVDFYSSFETSTLKLFIWKLIQTLEKFYKYNLSKIGGDLDKLLEPGQDLSYSATNYNKLHNAEWKPDYVAYQKVYSLDENQVFFETVTKIKSMTNIDFISEVFSNLTEKEKTFIQNAAKNYPK